ncbi:type II toxin-antitoxin system HigB family toxin [Halomonas sp. PR-M31]|uniref:type II toxin-antitoxin system HigB family toxin n=1 Tax=Halomonas sp. PR-M31 TaxID=1471202 RepID=UPI002646F7D1|nr:type II toxin-antitoxin system HigB family toxin [Halomonas sp. PR-M31]
MWEAKKTYPTASTALETWYRLMKSNDPKDFDAMKSLFPATDKVGSFHIFDIGSNKLRLIAVVQYQAKRVYIRYILDHKEYDKGKWKKG